MILTAILLGALSLFLQFSIYYLLFRQPRFNSLLTRVAVHEIGHSIVAWACTAVTFFDYATIVPDSSGNDGYVEYVIKKNAPWCRLAIAMAGVAGEVLVYGKFDALASEMDLEKAKKLAIFLKGTKCPFPLPENKKGKKMDFTKVFESISQEEATIIEQGYWMAKAIIESYGKRSDRAVSLLLKHKTCTEKHFEPVLGSREHLKLLEPTFVLPSK